MGQKQIVLSHRPINLTLINTIRILGLFCSVLIGVNPVISSAYSLLIVGITSLIGAFRYRQKQVQNPLRPDSLML